MRRLVCALSVLLALIAPAEAQTFVTGNTSLPSTKTNLHPIPATADPTRYIQASDYNALMNAALDLRTQITAGTYLGLSSQASAPSPVNSTNFLWYDGTSLYFKRSALGSASVIPMYDGVTRTIPSIGGMIMKNTNGVSPAFAIKNANSANMLFVDNNGVTINGPLALGAVETPMFSLINNTQATSGATLQLSPSIFLGGAVWNTTGAGSSSTYDWQIYARAISSATPSPEIAFTYSLNGGAETEALSMSTFTGLTMPGEWAATSKQGDGTTPAFNLNTTATFTSRDHPIFRLQNNGTTYLELNAEGTSSFIKAPTTLGFEVGGISDVAINSGALYANQPNISLGSMVQPWSTVVATGYNTGTAAAQMSFSSSETAGATPAFLFNASGGAHTTGQPIVEWADNGSMMAYLENWAGVTPRFRSTSSNIAFTNSTGNEMVSIGGGSIGFSVGGTTSYTLGSSTTFTSSTSSSPAWTFDTTSAINNVFYSLKMAGKTAFGFYGHSSTGIAEVEFFRPDTAAFMGGWEAVPGSPNLMWLDTLSLAPAVDNSQTNGVGGALPKRWKQEWAYQRLGVEQTVAAAASLTIDPTAGETVRITLSATAITTLTVSPGQPGQRLVVEVIQDATGGRSIPSTWTNVQFPGGTYTATATANKRDKINLDWDNTTAKWQATVALNL